MSDRPPLDEILDMVRTVAAPAAVTASAVFGAALLAAWITSRVLPFDWRRVAGPAAVLALAAVLLLGNRPPRELFPWPPEKPWHHAWPAVGLALAAELLARLPGVSAGVGHLLRGLTCGVIAAVVLPADYLADSRWWAAAFAGPAAVQWLVVAEVGKRSAGGSAALAVAVASGGASAVLLHAAGLGFLTVCTSVATALAAVAVMAWLTRSDGTSAAAVGTVPVLVMLLLGRTLQDSAVPDSSFLLVGFAPLTLGAFLLPRVSRFNDHRAGTLVKLLLVTIPVVVGVFLAMDAAPYTFGPTEEEW